MGPGVGAGSMGTDDNKHWASSCCLGMIVLLTLTCYEEQILRAQQLHVNPAEAVEEGLGQALAPAPLLQGVLGRKQVEGAWALEGLSQLGYEDFCSVVQHGVQPFQHALAGQVQLI